MTMRTKGSRRICIEGVDYRWMIKDNGDHFSLAVELHETPGQTMLVRLWRQDLPESFSITPSIVARLIQSAITEGWQPGQDGAEFKLKQLPSDLFH